MGVFNKEFIRNFVVISHVDHGKSTLADRFLEITGTVEKRRMKEQYLDQLELERERGITIKMAPVRMLYHPQFPISNFQFPNKSQNLNDQNQLGIKDSEFILNLIDTPGHSDFSYEVSRALAAVEGAILLVDATQGIQAQTLAKFHAAKKTGLKIIGAVTKIDLNPPMLNEIIKSTAELLGVSETEIFRVSGKTGEGVNLLLEEIIKQIPPPKAEITNYQLSITNLSRALIFDSFYHEHKGIVAAARIFNGEFFDKQAIHLIAADTSFKIKELGYFSPELKSCAKLENGQIGYIATGLKNPELLKIGDTIIGNRELGIRNYGELALPGYQEPQSAVFASFYPEDNDEYEDLKNALAKLKLNDSSLKFEPDFNEFLGRGFKVGFLGQLHFEITSGRLEKEFNIRTIHSFPSVSYKVKPQGEEWIVVNNPKDFPNDYLEAMEPIVLVKILTPSNYLGDVLKLQKIFRLRNISAETLGNSGLITAAMPLADLIRDFDDQLKSVSAGYASLNYEISGYAKTEVAKLEVLVAGQKVSGLTRIIHKEDIEREAKRTAEKLKELLPRQQFAQAIQVIANGRVVAREDIQALRKDVTSYLYGGDRTRKMKLWKKQKRGKEKLKELSSRRKINVPANVFKELLKK
jgi:GTP-binding protein LepA